MNEIDARRVHMCVAVLKPLAMLPDRDAQIAYVHAHPVVLSELCIQLGRSRPELTAIYDDILPLFGAREKAVDGRAGFTLNPDRYPFGKGPIEAIWREMEDGEVSEARALELVSERGVAGDLLFVYAVAATDRTLQMTMDGDAVRAARRHRIVVEAAEQLSPETSLLTDDDQWRIRFTIGRTWLDVASQALAALPDGRMFHHALTLGETLAAEAEQRQSVHERGYLLSRLGVLHLDPYTTNRETSNYAVEIKRWRARLAAEFGDDAARAIDAAWPMPAPEQALERADTLLTASLALQKANRGETGTALAQCLMFRRKLGSDVADDRVRSVINDALAELATTDDHERISRLQLYLQHLDD